METIVLFWCVGILLFFLWLRPTKAQVRKMASNEFAAFVNAIGQWNLNRSDVTARTCALDHFSLYERRMHDLSENTDGVLLPRASFSAGARSN